MDKYQIYAEKLKAIAHPHRLKIIEGLLNDECNVTHIVKCMAMPQATVSQHLRILKSAGIIEGRRDKMNICYKVVDRNIKKIFKDLLGKSGDKEE
ncbi:MAG: metalloregulator ArsR/SmtB family transcription factor [Elusimicrobiota bacterium]